jgi:hypothetical protein
MLIHGVATGRVQTFGRARVIQRVTPFIPHRKMLDSNLYWDIFQTIQANGSSAH